MEAACREVEEETGYRLAEIQPLMEYKPLTTTRCAQLSVWLVTQDVMSPKVVWALRCRSR